MNNPKSSVYFQSISQKDICKLTQKILFVTAIRLWNKKMSKQGLRPISSSTERGNNNRRYLFKYQIFHCEIACKYTFGYTESYMWISVKMNIYFWCISKNMDFSFEIPGSAHVFLLILQTKHKSWIEETTRVFLNH